MKILIFIIVNLILINPLFFANEINEYPLLFEKTIAIGNSENKLGYNPQMGLTGGTTGPSAFNFDNLGNIYICDTINKRIVVFASNFDYKYFLEEKEYNKTYYADKIKIDNFGDIISYVLSKGIIKLNKNGKTIFKIKNIKNKYNFFPVEDHLVIYNSENKYSLINAVGEELKDDKMKFKLKEFKEKNVKNINLTTDIPAIAMDKLDNFLKEKNLFQVDNKLITSDFKKHREYFNFLTKEMKTIKNGKNIYDRIDNIFTVVDEINLILIGFDSDGNSYWSGWVLSGDKKVVLVCSNYGEILDCFYNTLGPRGWEAVAPNGDVYFMYYKYKEDTGIHFYKVARQW